MSHRCQNHMYDKQVSLPLPQNPAAALKMTACKIQGKYNLNISSSIQTILSVLESHQILRGMRLRTIPPIGNSCSLNHLVQEESPGPEDNVAIQLVLLCFGTKKQPDHKASPVQAAGFRHDTPPESGRKTQTGLYFVPTPL